MIEFVAEGDGRRIDISMSGTISVADIDDVNERLEQSASVLGIQTVLLDWSKLIGWEKGARTVGTWFGMRHWGGVRRVAILADEAWDDETIRIADIYKTADVQRFPADRRADALSWLKEI